MANPQVSKPVQSELERLRPWLQSFEQGWHDGALAEWTATRLSKKDLSLRRTALAELIKIDLKRQWQLGRRPSLEDYLARYPELGTSSSVRGDLVLTEYQVSRHSGAPIDLAELIRRYPRHASLLAEAAARDVPAASADCLSVEQPSQIAARETSRPSPTHDTEATSSGPSGRTAEALPEQFGRYRIIRKLGAGGMGAVYLAHDSQLERQVALKVPHFSARDGRNAVERFLREARAAATLQHPGLCPVYDVGQIDDTYYMTMAYIEGHPLSEYLGPDNAPMPERKAAALVRGLALALHEAHAHGIVHRDLKPSNIMLNQRGQPVIMDFGLARRTDSEDVALTREGAVLGTPAYMAPEQARGKIQQIGPWTDVYSLGVILYELLTGSRPFRGELIEVLAQILTDDPVPPSQLRPGLDPRLEAICLKAMAKDVEHRYQTMAEFAAALADCKQAGKSAAPRTGPEAEIPIAPPAPPAIRRPAVAKPEVVLAEAVEESTQSSSPTWTDHHSAASNSAFVKPGQEAANRALQRTQLHPPRDLDEDLKRGWHALATLGKRVVQAASDFDNFIQTTVGEENVIIYRFLQIVLYVIVPVVVLCLIVAQFWPANQDIGPSGSAPPPVLTPAAPYSIPADNREPAPTGPLLSPPAKFHSAPSKVGPVITNSIGMRMTLIPAGEFLMGAPDSDRDASSDEKPQHRVRITKPFYLGIYEVTQSEYERVMGTNPSQFKGEGGQLPVETVSWEDAQEFCRRLSALPEERRVGAVYRLPTEAEWEYACRAGSKTKWSFGDDESQLTDHAWYSPNAGGKTHPVGQKKPNAWGLYDMHGNVLEWGQDWWKRDYTTTAVSDPTGPESGSLRVIRGGSWGGGAASSCRASCRDGGDPGDRHNNLGFRLLRAVC